MHCVSVCGNCHGTDCSNGGVTADETNNISSDSEEESCGTEHVVESNDPQFFYEDIDFFYVEEI